MGGGNSPPGELHGRQASAKARAEVRVAAVAYSGLQIPRMSVYPRPSMETHNPKIPNYGPAFNPFLDKVVADESTFADSDASRGGGRQNAMPCRTVTNKELASNAKARAANDAEWARLRAINGRERNVEGGQG